MALLALGLGALGVSARAQGPSGVPGPPAGVSSQAQRDAPAALPKGRAFPAPGPAGESLEQFGLSAAGTPLVACVFDGGGTDTTLILGGVHGDERATPGVVERLRDLLRRQPGLWQGRRVVLVPRMNPDGLRAGKRANARGVDLNRNLPCGWRRRARHGRYYPGSHPSSEPETQALIALIARYRPSKVISIHQPLHCLDYTGARGRALALVLRRANGYRLVSGNRRVLPGCLGGYCGNKLGLAMVTLELPRGSASAAWRRNQAALIAAIRCTVPGTAAREAPETDATRR